MNQGWKFYRKLHRWPGLIVSFILFYYGVTGIIMNHREFFSGLEVSRHALPKDFQYKNWNNSAIKSNLIINSDSILVYGNIGIWTTDSAFIHYRNMNNGFPKGADNRKIFDVHHPGDGNLYAATQFGLYVFNQQEEKWEKFDLEVDIDRFVAIESIGDTLYVLNRSYLFKGESQGPSTEFKKIELDQPLGYKKEVSLFETIWQIHSGEILGLPGKLFVDFLGIITIFLSLTGIIFFFFPGWIRKRKRKQEKIQSIVKINRWSLKWHNRVGAWIFVFLILLFFTGMFLRPPLLIAIGYTKVKPIKFSHLDQPNPWYDKLRDLLYDKDRDIFLLSTSDGMYYMKRESSKPVRFKIQPPVSVMGINTLEPYGNGAFLVGSFSGLFAWHPSYPTIYNLVEGTLYKGVKGGRPVGDFKVTGIITCTQRKKYMVDYDKGVIALKHGGRFPGMPKNVEDKS